MKILHLLGSRNLPANPDNEGVSGVVRAALEFARAQVHLGHEVSIAVIGSALWQSTWNGVQLIGLSSIPWAPIHINGRILDFRQHIPYIFFTRRYTFDIVHGHLYSYMRFLWAKGYVAHFHSDPFYAGHNNEKYDLKSADLDYIARNTDAQIAVSQFICDDLKRGLHGLGNVYLVRYGIDTELFDPKRWQEESLSLRREWGIPENGIVFLFAGAIVPEKGVIQLVRVFSRLAAQNSNLHLALAGTSKLWRDEGLKTAPSDSYEGQVRDNCLGSVAAERIHFLGKVASSKMPAVYAACDVLVVPSIWREAFGLVALEALASGRPVIASSVGGLVEFVNEQNGLLVSPEAEGELENAMRALAESRELRQKLGSRGRAHALLFSWHLAAQQLDAIYKRILEKKVKL